MGFYQINSTTGIIKHWQLEKEMIARATGHIWFEGAHTEDWRQRKLIDNSLTLDSNLVAIALAEENREKRDLLLVQEVDPIVTNPLRWAELTDAKQAEWTQYRTDLLNLPAQAGFPNTVTWPTKPT